MPSQLGSKSSLALSQGQRASLYVTYAEAVALPAQDREQYQKLLEQALAVDPELRPNKKLQTALAQRRARWLLQRMDRLFL